VRFRVQDAEFRVCGSGSAARTGVYGVSTLELEVKSVGFKAQGLELRV